LELVSAAGIALAAKEIGNDSAGFAEALAWIAEHAPGPRIAVALEGTRSYGVGLARALNAAGLTVIEVEQPRRGDRRNGKSDPIDAHLAALHALRMNADRLPAPRADGDREALRILLRAQRIRRAGGVRGVHRHLGRAVPGDHQAVGLRVDRIRAVPAVRQQYSQCWSTREGTFPPRPPR
jgi:transposase